MKFLNPVYKRELKQTARMRRTAVLIFCYNALLAMLGLFSFYITFGKGNKYYHRLHYEDILIIYGIIIGIEFVLFLLLVPALTAGAISGEREKQTLNILLTTKLTPFQIIWGKLLSSISIMILLAVSSLPVIALCFAIGGITLLDLAKFLLLLIITAIYLGSISIFFSTCCKRTTAATVCSYFAMLVLVFFSIVLVVGVLILSFLEEKEVSYRTSSLFISYGKAVGNWIYILLINPVISFLAMLKDQIGYGAENGYLFLTSSKMSPFFYEHWFAISLFIQLLLSFFFLWLASKKLNPWKKKHVPIFKKEETMI